MNKLLEVADVSKQAMQQYFVREELFYTRLAGLFAEADALREVHPGCGVEKMYYVLRPDWLGRDRFIDVMMNHGYRLLSRRSFIRTTYPGIYQYQNLAEGMLLWKKNQLWQSDITYFRVGERFYYLVFIIDVYTKQILGYRVSDHMRAEANLIALQMAIKACGGSINGLVHHSDRGSQYGDKEYTGLLRKNGALISMGMKAQDNAYAESLNGIIKTEYLNHWKIASFADLKKKVKQAVIHYNEQRSHGSLPDRLSPNAFEQNLLSLDCQKRPTVIVYAEGNPEIKGASIPFDLLPEKTTRAPVCPIVN
jgi:putative transposase